MFIIFNIWAIAVGLGILAVVSVLMQMFPGLMNGPHELLVFGIVTMVVGGGTEYFGIRGRVFFLPIWLIGLAIVCFQIGWIGTAIFVAFLVAGFFWLIQIGKKREREHWLKAQEALRKTPTPAASWNEGEFWQWVNTTLTLPSSKYTPEICDHNLKVLQAVQDRKPQLRPDESARLVLLRNFLVQSSHAPKPADIDWKLRRAVIDLIESKLKDGSSKPTPAAVPPLIPKTDGNSVPPPIPATGGRYAAPEGPLEELFCKMKYGGMTLQQLAPDLLNAKVFVLQQQFDPSIPHKVTAPMTVSGPDHAFWVAAFTSLSRAKPAMEGRPDYKHACEVPVADLIASLPAVEGIHVNPGWKDGMQIPATALRDSQG